MLCFQAGSLFAQEVPNFIAVEAKDQGRYNGVKVTPQLVTHSISSGGDVTSVGKAMKLGISKFGGGYINSLEINLKPSAAALSPVNLVHNPTTVGGGAALYGRGGQTALRDAYHKRTYNPTQAGFTDQTGTICTVNPTTLDGSAALIIPTRPCSLWSGDQQYDFCYYNGIVDTPAYNRTPVNWATSNDTAIVARYGIDRANREAQAEEITSEFDYFGNYSDVFRRDHIIHSGVRLDFGMVNGSNQVNIPCIRHYVQYTYRRKPGFAMGKHTGPDNASRLDGNIKVKALDTGSLSYPTGTPISATNVLKQADLGIINFENTLRIEWPSWKPRYRFLSKNGVLESSDRYSATYRIGSKSIYNAALRNTNNIQGFDVGAFDPAISGVDPLLILASTNNPDTSVALGFYRPYSPINARPVVVSPAAADTENLNPYEGEDRNLDLTPIDNFSRLDSTMPGEFDYSQTGFLCGLTGIRQPRVDASGNVVSVETMRGEYYILYGTPNEILENAQRIQSFAAIKQLDTEELKSIRHWKTWFFKSNSYKSELAGDEADPDKDGLNNLVEYALGTSPVAPNRTVDTECKKNNTTLDFYYVKNATAVNLKYEVEWSSNLLSASWSKIGVGAPVLDATLTATNQQRMKVTMPAGTNSRRFVRLKVTQL